MSSETDLLFWPLVLPVTTKDPRGAVLGQIAKPHDLKHAETTDKSAPVIEGTL